MLDRTRDFLTSSFADCPGCRMAMIHRGSQLVSDRSGMIDRFECAPCGITRMRPRQATSAGELDALAFLTRRS
jgi:hypothetical protein